VVKTIPIEENFLGGFIKPMKRKIILTLVMVMSFSLVFAQEKEVKLEKIWEKEFEEEVVGVAFGSEEEIALYEKQGKFPHPRTVVFKSKIKFFDSEGNVLREISLEKIGYHRLNLLSSGKVLREGMKSELEYNLELYDEKGNLVWTKRNMGNESFVSGDEKYIVTGMRMTGAEGKQECVLYSIDGEEIWRKKVETYPWMVHILYNGRVILVELITEEHKTIGARLTLIDTDGKKLWSKELAETSDYYVFSTRLEENNLMVISPYGKQKIYIYTEEGSLLWEKKTTGYVTDLSISYDSQYAVFLCWSRDDKRYFVQMMDLKGRKIVWERTNPEFINFDYASISQDNKYILLESSPQIAPQEKKYVVLLDVRNGEILEEIRMTDSVFGKFISGSNKFLLKSGSRILVQSISE
jgi:hypothetical protein